MHPKVKQIIPYLISLGCLAYVVWGIDLATLTGAFKKLELWPIALVQCISIALYVPIVFRLCTLSDGLISPPSGLVASLIRAAVNTLFPAHLGEGARALVLSRENAFPLKQVLGILFWERFSDLNALLLIAVLAGMHTTSVTPLAVLASVVTILWLVVVTIATRPKVVESLIQILPWTSVRSFFSGLSRTLSDKFTARHLIPLALYAVMIWGPSILGFAIAANYGANLGLSISQILLVFAAGVIGIAVPSGPAGIGVYESFVVAALQLCGIAKEQALAFALVMHAIQIILPTILGTMLLPRLSNSFKNLFSELQASHRDSGQCTQKGPDIHSKSGPK